MIVTLHKKLERVLQTRGIFCIDPVTQCYFFLHFVPGVLTVADVLDYESTTSYRLHIAASDGGCPRLEAVSTVDIRVSNVDDHEPRFDQRRYEVFLSEDVPPGTVVVQLNAIDGDTLNGMH